MNFAVFHVLKLCLLPSVLKTWPCNNLETGGLGELVETTTILQQGNLHDFKDTGLFKALKI